MYEYREDTLGLVLVRPFVLGLASPESFLDFVTLLANSVFVFPAGWHEVTPARGSTRAVEYRVRTSRSSKRFELEVSVSTTRPLEYNIVSNIVRVIDSMFGRCVVGSVQTSNDSNFTPPNI